MRKHYSPTLKAKVVLELLKEEKTISNFSKFMEVAFSGLEKKDIDRALEAFEKVGKKMRVI